MASTKTLVTAQHLWEMSSDTRFELVHGELVPMSPIGKYHGHIVLRLGFCDGAPDLAIEVLPPSEKASEVQVKVYESLTAGTRLVWVVDPRSETVTAYHPSGEAHMYSGELGLFG